MIKYQPASHDMKFGSVDWYDKISACEPCYEVW